ncbi:hypothetical protein G7054_g1864 [Neopestalotiopsis clavispora]|nr:hypothetical protein G7054_g1864 [Neopestalotiopsis clavispora]
MDNPRITFSYEGLGIAKDQKQIRLLRLLPSLSNADQISCTLEVVSWAPELRYAAISYVWGDPNITQAIFVNGERFEVTENLHSALWHIRKNDMLRQQDDPEHTGDLPLWVDAVCIDQHSIGERNHQVALMSLIYGSASKVICWLGMRKDNQGRDDPWAGDAVIGFIQELTEAAFHGSPDLDEDSLMGLFNFRKGLYTQNPIPVDASGRKEFDVLDTKIWRATRDMLQSEFWKRVWIIQEMVLPISDNILIFTCGNSVITWTKIIQFLGIVNFFRESDAESLGLPHSLLNVAMIIYSSNYENFNLLSSMRQIGKEGRKLDAGSLPLLLHRHKATDPRDYVYGFDAVISIGQEVDYNKSRKEVYTDWFKTAIDLGRVDLLAYAGIGLRSPEKPEWSSWLPDLTSIQMTLPGSNQPARSATTPDKSAFREASEIVTGDVLHISGVNLGDTVEKIFAPEPTAPKYKDGKTVRFLHLVCFSILANASSHHPSGIRPLQGFLLTLVNCFKHIGSMPFEYPPDGNNPALAIVLNWAYDYPGLDHDDYVSTYGPKWIEMGFENNGVLEQVLLEQFLGVGRSWDSVFSRSIEPSALELLSKIFYGLEGYTTFQTKKGYIGIGPLKLKEGDAVCFLSRSKTPILLREEKTGGTTGTKVVGACYMYGLSDLVIKEWVASGKVNVERFSLH